MKKYINVLAWIILITCGLSTGAILIGASESFFDGDFEESFVIFLFFVPTYIVGSYTWATFNGRNNAERINIKHQKYFIYGHLAILSVIISIALIFTYHYITISEKVKEPINLGNYDIFGDKAELTIKYESHDLKCKIFIKFSKPVMYLNKKYFLNVIDKHGFKIESNEIENYTQIKNSSQGDIIGIQAEESFWIEQKDYINISTYTISVQ